MYPYYLLAKLYAEPEFYQEDKFRAAAGAVLTKEPKVESTAVREMRTEIKKMVENDTYCTDILVQVSAVNAALNSFNKVLLANHIRTCVAEDIREGKDETIDELVKVLQKLMK